MLVESEEKHSDWHASGNCDIGNPVTRGIGVDSIKEQNLIKRLISYYNSNCIVFFSYGQFMFPSLKELLD